MDLFLINPNTGTLPAFADVNSAAVVRAVHQRIPILSPESSKAGSEWDILPCAEMFHMSKKSHLFVSNSHVEACLAKRGLNGCASIAEEVLFPLYEAKMIHQYDHRFADVVVEERNLYRQGQSSHLSEAEHASCERFAIPRYWISSAEAKKALDNVPFYIVFRKLTDATTNARTGVFAILSNAVTADTLQMIYPESSLRAADTSILLATLNSFVLDFVLRQKIGGMHFGIHILKQLPVPNVKVVESWLGVFAKLPLTFVRDRVLELTYTAWDLETFAQNCGWFSPPFRWDEERRFWLRCELDAAFFQLYLGSEAEWRQQPAALTQAFPTPRAAVSYIMGTFPIVKRKDEEKFNGDYRTKRTILEIYDALAEVQCENRAYVTQLNPAPASILVTHPPRYDRPRANVDVGNYILGFVGSLLRHLGGECDLMTLVRAYALLLPDRKQFAELAAAQFGTDARGWAERFTQPVDAAWFLPILRGMDNRDIVSLEEAAEDVRVVLKDKAGPPSNPTLETDIFLVIHMLDLAPDKQILGPVKRIAPKEARVLIREVEPMFV
jgi:hypothetical protein